MMPNPPISSEGLLPGGTLAVVTPSYLPDRELCSDLNRSVLEMTEPDVVHHIIVPDQDFPAFSGLRGPRTEVHVAREFLPRSFVKAPGLNVWINAAHPWPPIRGWIAQQIIKLAVVSRLDVDGALLLDSDSILIRQTSLDTFRKNGRIALYRAPDAVDDTLPRHRLWHVTARRLLGLDPPPTCELADYVCWPCLWEPPSVRTMLQHIQNVTGRHWSTAIGAHLHFSEMMLYGLYVDEVVAGMVPTVREMRGIVHTAEVPLSEAEIQLLLSEAPHDKNVVMLSAKAGIPLEVRRRALRSFLDSSLGPERGEVQ
ncbi:DUF6492 family protein [Paenarthrobacter aurescens]|nr:DUF6492 family protein [Paenarthrobacter aurescens]MDO6147450.1 DUF6492 family protein [Paenarthrobacter aurescens]MDO6158694.1 DUF6492 family protein [Paenarthrobacter aurescens]MDO6162677.1 DUF6492 family protein [Paenarthrobacter aurescens]